MRAIVIARAALLRLVTVALSLVITLLLLELVARSIPLWPDKISDFDPELGFAHIPGTQGWWVNIRWPFEFRTYVTISSQGLRDREFDLEKPAGVTRVLLLGDSMVDGLEVPLEDTFAKQLERLFRESGRDVEVINGGHYGYGTDQELLFYRHRGRQFQPDVVVLWFVTNDVESNLSAETLGPKPFFELGSDDTLQLRNFPVEPPEPPAVSKASFLKRVKQILYTHSKLYRFTAYHVRRDLPALGTFFTGLGVMEQPGESVPIETSTSDCQERGWTLTRALILGLKQEVESSEAQFVLVLPSDFRHFAPGAQAPTWNNTDWIDCLERLCAESGLQCLDLYPTFRSLAGQHKTFFYPRDGHPTAEGHFHIAEALYDYLSTRLP